MSDHPNDDTGDALRRLEAHGDDLRVPRDIDFNVVFPDSSKAEGFAAHFREKGYQATVQHAKVKETHPWDVLVVKHMIPSHRNISDFEHELEETATKLNGINDGWGCFSAKDSDL